MSDHHKRDWGSGSAETPYLRAIKEAEADPQVRAVFEEIERYHGYVPTLYRTLAHHPLLLRANWDKTRAVMDSGPLSERAKETIAVAVSLANDCEYCVRIHGRRLKKLGISAAELEALMRVRLEELSFLDEKEKALVRLMHKINVSAPSVERSDIDTVRGLGATDQEIVHALGVLEVYVAYNKLLVALRVHLD